MSAEALPLNDIKIFEFITIYKKNECLWNTKLECYHTPTQQNRAFASIALKFNISTESVKATIRELNAIYLQERDRILIERIKGNKENLKSCFWYNSMQFLDEVAPFLPIVIQNKKQAQTVSCNISRKTFGNLTFF